MPAAPKAAGVLTPRLLTVAEAAVYLSLSPRELRVRVRRGEIGAVRLHVTSVTYTRARQGRDETVTYTRACVRFRVDDLDAWIASRYAPPKAARRPSPDQAAPSGPKPWELLPRRQRRFA